MLMQSSRKGAKGVLETTLLRFIGSVGLVGLTLGMSPPAWALAQDPVLPPQEALPSAMDRAEMLEARKHMLQTHLQLLTLRLETLNTQSQQMAQAIQREQRTLSSLFSKVLFSLRETPTALLANHVKPEAYVHTLAIATSILQSGSKNLEHAQEKATKVGLMSQAAQAEFQRYQAVLTSLERDAKAFETEHPAFQPDFELHSERSPKLELPAEGTFVAPPVTLATSEKVSIRTAFLAPVMCPASGKVTYVGPLKGIQQAVIIDHGDNYYSILSGFEKRHVHLGDTLFQGETVATMAGYGKDNPVLEFEFLKPPQASQTTFLKWEERSKTFSLRDGT
jgi:murein DD-endopeptidase MepM/ murein hydrolase activator NlpD